MVLEGSRSERSQFKIETITGEAAIAMVAGEGETQTEEPSTVAETCRRRERSCAGDGGRAAGGGVATASVQPARVMG
ncbi:hypothetical protein EUGRSUZ_E02546 [Eucalyptus grandis]|uniref:Uncharacterized protein n=2 Tax=Eucalyptus grandis TaxID=71139 RepID=A0ACC3KXJ6_EUCGR|nr:hypothetical protein EUGRSUZ_E02546 [Eucalyptus grandis]